MKVVFTNKLIQSKETPYSEVQLIDGIRYNWTVKTVMMKIGETFQEWLVRMETDTLNHEFHKDTIGLVIYDVMPIKGVPMLPNSEKWQGEGAMMVRYDYINHTK